MKRAKVFCGPRSNKTRTAKKLAEGKETVWINGRNPRIFEDPFLFHSCNEKTELIIFDDTPEDFNYELVRDFLFDEKMMVNNRCKAPCEIETPEIIITTNFLPSWIGIPSADMFLEVTRFPDLTILNPETPTKINQFNRNSVTN